MSDAVEDEKMKSADVEPFTFFFLKFWSNLFQFSLANLVGSGLAGKWDVTIDLYNCKSQFYKFTNYILPKSQVATIHLLQIITFSNSMHFHLIELKFYFENSMYCSVILRLYSLSKSAFAKFSLWVYAITVAFGY